MKKQLIFALLIITVFAGVCITSNPRGSEAYKVNHGVTAKI